MVERIEEKTESCSIFILVLKKDKTKLFHTYCVCLLIK